MNKKILAVLVASCLFNPLYAGPLIKTQQDFDNANGYVKAHDTDGKELVWRPVEPSEVITGDKLVVDMLYMLPHKIQNPTALFISKGEFSVSEINVKAKVYLNPDELDANEWTSPEFTGISLYKGKDDSHIYADKKVTLLIDSENLGSVNGIKSFATYNNYIKDLDITINDKRSVLSADYGNRNYGDLYGINNRLSQIEIDRLNLDLNSDHAWIMGVRGYNTGTLVTSNIKIGDDSFIKINLSNKDNDEKVNAPTGIYLSSRAIATVGDNLRIEIDSNAKNAGAHGLYANYDGGELTIGNQASISVIDRSTKEPFSGAGAYVSGEKSKLTIGDDLTIDYTSKFLNGFAVQAMGGETHIGENATFNVTADNLAVGIFSALQRYPDGKEVRGSLVVDKGLTINATGGQAGIGLFVPGGSVELNGLNADLGLLILSDYGGKVTGNAGNYQISGGIQGENQSVIDLTLAENSNFVGVTSLDDSSTVNIRLKEDATWYMVRPSALSELSLDSKNARLVVMGDGLSVLADSFKNGGIIDFSQGDKGFKNFTIDQNYSGNDGLLIMRAELNGDQSKTDHLTVEGDTSGSTEVQIVKQGGQGAQTINGIEIIAVDGKSEGVFKLKGDKPVRAGSYDYFLNRGKSSETASNWYLISEYNPSVDPEPPIKPEKPNKPVYRPEIGSYLANLAASNTLFVHGLHDRLGQTHYIDLLSGEVKQTSMWMRHVGSHVRFKDSTDQLKTKEDRYVMQIGGDLIAWNQNQARYHLGLMGGYAYSSSKTTSNVTGYAAKGKVDGYSLGLYGTWYQNSDSKEGAYADGWLLYSRFDNKVERDGYETEKYRSRGITASIEGGYRFKVGESESGKSSYFIEPKAQLIYMGVDAKDHHDIDNTLIKGAKDNIQTRLGVRAYVSGYDAYEKGDSPNIEYFVEANWIHNSRPFDISFDGMDYNQKGTRNAAEIKVGLESRINDSWHLWGNLSHQFGKKGYRDTQAMFGVKYLF